MQWLRLYTEVLDDPKVQRLPDHLFKTWINLLCLARKHDGKLPADVQDMAFALRLPEDEMRTRFDALKDAGLFVDEGSGPEPNNWNGRQFKSDHNAAERMRRSRERKALRNGDVTRCADVAPPEQRQNRTEQRQREGARDRASPAPKKSKPETRATRLPEQWEPPPKDWQMAVRELGDSEAVRQLAMFRDHFRAVKGDKGLKLDWAATWRNWVRRAPNFGSNSVRANGHDPPERLTADGLTPEELNAARERLAKESKPP